MTRNSLPAARHPWLLPCLCVAVLLLAALSLAFGPVGLSPRRIAALLTGQGDAVASAIIFDLRLPRMILGLLVGGALGLTGAVLQGYLRNPLAEPSVLGTSSAASLGAVIALYFGLANISPVVLPVLSIMTAVAALLLLFFLAGRSESALTLILAGIALSTLAAAGVSLALNLAPNPFAGMEIMNWLLGSLENRSMDHVLLATPCIVVGCMMLLTMGRTLDALSLGEDGAQSLGFDLVRGRWMLVLGVALAVGGAVAVSGSIGFVGLIVPHLVRPMTDRSPSALLLPSMLAGALLLTLSDIAVRVIPAQNELKLGVVTAFLGVPVFLFHLMRERRLW